MDNQTRIELTDPKEIADFMEFCKHKQTLINENNRWQQVKTFSKNMGFGSFSLIVKDGLPVRIDNAIQQVIIQII